MLKISKMTGKLAGIPAINTNTLTNPFCLKMHASKRKDSICSQCYSFAMLETFRANCAPAWQKNSEILSHSVIVDHLLPDINATSFRFDAGCAFTLWTKRKDLINQAEKSVDPNSTRPHNLILIYSNPWVDSIMYNPPRYFDKVFNNTSEKTKEDNCSGRRCLSCLQCYRKDSGVDVIIEAVK